MATLKQKCEKALRSLGFSMIEGELGQANGRYGIMRGYIFIGSHGSVRIGQCKSAKHSHARGEETIIVVHCG